MLCLARHKDEQVHLIVGGETLAVVTVTSIRGNKVVLGFEAGQEVVIKRKELLESKEFHKP